MGCCQTRKIKPFDEFENLIGQSESKLGLSNIKLSSFFRSFSKVARNNNISETDFERTCRNLQIGIDDASVSRFFSLNYTKPAKNYDFYKLSSLGALLCVGTRDEKMKLLFSISQDDRSQLSKENLVLMISTLCDISLKELVCFGLSYKMSQDSCDEYRLDLNSGVELIKKYHVNNILDLAGKDFLTYETFERALAFKENSTLVVPSLFRRHAYKLRKVFNMIIEIATMSPGNANEVVPYKGMRKIRCE